MLARALKTKNYNGGVKYADLDEELPFDEKVTLLLSIFIIHFTIYFVTFVIM